MNHNVVYCILAASVILGTVGGILEHFAAQGGDAYKVGVFLASAGTDLAGLVKLLAGGAASTSARGFAGLRLLASIAAIAVVGCFGVAVYGCLVPPSPAQQITDFTTAEQCVSNDWGKPIATVATDCFQGAIPVAEDIVADIEALVELAGGLPAASPYPQLRAKVDAHKATHK